MSFVHQQAETNEALLKTLREQSETNDKQSDLIQQLKKETAVGLNCV